MADFQQASSVGQEIRYSIEACLEELRIPVDKLKRHDAVQDAYATHLIFQALKRIL